MVLAEHLVTWSEMDVFGQIARPDYNYNLL